MPTDSSDTAEVAAIFERLRAEVRASAPRTSIADTAAPPLPSRRELDALWAVSGDRPYFGKPGRWGRLRRILLVPVKALTKKLVRWYVEPIAADQRAFNAGVLRTLDELSGWVAAEVQRLESARPDDTDDRRRH